MLPLIGEPNTLVGRKMQGAIGLVEFLAGDEIDPFIGGDDVDVSEGDLLCFRGDVEEAEGLAEAIK